MPLPLSFLMRGHLYDNLALVGRIKSPFLVMGGNADALISMAQLLLKKRVNLTFRIVPGGTHSEASWEKQIPVFMDCLGL